jgi:hypothetical protein
MITQDEFVQLLTKYSGVIDLSTSTKLKMNKGGRGGVAPNPFYDKDVRKVKTSTYEVGANYREKISEALVAEGLSQEKRDEFGDTLPWGEYEVKDKVVAYNGKRYLRCYPIKDAEAFEEILVDGEVPSEEDLKTIMSYVPERSGSKKQEDAGITEENRVRPLLFAFDNITCAVFNGTRYDFE